MNAISNILSSIPLFRHCLEDEIAALQKIGKLASVRKGHQFDLKKINAFNVVVGGVFEIESMGKTDVVHLAPGSFFGAIPFTGNRQTGKIRALVDSTLLMFRAEDMYRFFLMSYKCLRGYLKIAARLGFDISDVGKKYFSGNSKIITVYGPAPGSGKTLLASLLAHALGKDGKTVLLDVSSAGNSLFNVFEKKITIPLAQRAGDDPSLDRIIGEWTVPVDDNLHLLNIAFGSKVRVNPEILSPLLFMLSKEYRYIVLDCPDDDAQLRDRVFGLSDLIFAIVKNRKDVRPLYELFDTRIREGQRVSYVINEQYAGTVHDCSGGIVLPALGTDAPAGEFDRIRRLSDGGAVAPMLSLVRDRRRALVFETNLLLALCFGGFLDSLHGKEKRFDLYYGSAYSYIILSLYLLSGGRSEFRKRIGQFFSDDRINKLIDITFPTEYVFKNSLVMKHAAELCGDARIEMFRDLPVAMLGQDGSSARRLFSTGYLRDAMAASFCLYPVFEQIRVNGQPFNSGFPDFRVRVEDLFRVDVDETVYVSIENSAALNYREGTMNRFFGTYLEFAGERTADDKVSDLSDTSIVLEVSERDISIDRIMDDSRELSDRLLKELSF